MRFVTFLGVFSFAATAAFADISSGLAALDAGDVEAAAADFQASYQEGDGDGAFYLGRLFEFGVGTDKDISRAANLYAAGAEAGSLLAMNRLGLMYLEGTTLLRDYAEAARLFCEAADQGEPNSQLNCALMLKDGKGVEVDGAKAVEYLTLAADQGNVAAINILAQMYKVGDVVAVDLQKAQSLFAKTAEMGNAMGMYEVALHHLEGEAPDLVTAYAFANLAAVRGHEEALALRDKLEAEMSVQDVNAAQAKSRAWTEERIAAQAASPAEE